MDEQKNENNNSLKNDNALPNIQDDETERIPIKDDLSEDNFTKSDPPSSNDEEPTETLLTDNLPAPAKKRKKLFIALGVIAAVLIVGAMSFLILAQLKTSEINKSLDLGEQYLEEGKYEEAILAFDKVITIDKKNVAAYEGKGASYLGLDNYPEAEAQLETAKSIDFTDTGKVLMADVYINTNRKDQGVTLIEEVVKNQPGETKTIIQISNLYNQISEYTKIIELLEKKIATTEDKDELKKLYDALIPAYVKAGKSEAEILALLEKATSATGDQSYLQKKDSYIVKKPSLSLAPGEYQGEQILEIVKGNPTDKLYYTIDGSPPTIASPEYTAPVNLIVGETMVKTIAVNANGVSCSPIEGKYVITQSKLSDSEFISALYGGWYYNSGKAVQLVVSNKHIYFGSLNSGAATTGSYTIESTTKNGGTVSVITPVMEGSTEKSSVSIEFDFGAPGDNKISIHGNDGLWYEFIAAESAGNGQFRLPGMGLNGSDYLSTVYSTDF